ncbi:3-hydroxyisobutyryl-CoA hydrolase, mitochondrial [Galendromus occidentalis]|uniref:3-hydroxyisobutyryl-CoA hydrolase, mitochondrial n=1 Tax=Galendromus occidentalis TaxID=34638 RepID=A0AAJ6VZF1_9ACAR|nr:3-hydroxyisobutyryl-CoA hydrolase, mitochondrial [Galendromus occidentalis]XP_003746338.1 3-hydroxyisobutyryl-CoA hydrolase, mitochondrial [Galendromus occidentalis]
MFCLLRLKPSSVISRAMSTGSSEDVLLQLRNGKGIITMNRPKALNALSLPMIRVIEPVVRKWHKEDLAKLVLLKACDGKAFCAGGDVKAIAAVKGNNDAFFREEYVLDYLLAKMKPPLVPLIDGIVMGGGCGISFHSPFQVVSEKALFAMPETAIGLFPDVGGCHFLSRLEHNLGVFLGLTGNRLRGEDLVHAGLVSHFAPSTKFPELEEEILALEDCSQESIEKILDKYQPTLGKFSLEPHLREIEECFSPDTVEAIFEKLKSRGGEFCGKQLELLNKMSPLSLKVTLKAIREAKSMDLKQVLEMDMRLGKRFLDDHDFYEGVNALLVRKSNDPKWRPASLEECTPELVDKYFLKLPASEELQLVV